jgi:hypothetical protein
VSPFLLPSALVTKKFTPQIGALYQDAVESLRFFKQQQWKVTNYALLIYATIYIVRKEMETCAGKFTLVAIASLTFVASVAVLTWHELSIVRARNRVDKINEDYFTDAERSDLNIRSGTRWLDHSIWLLLCFVSLGGAVMASWLVRQ